MADVFLIMAWVIASIYNKAAIEHIYLDPEDQKKAIHPRAEEEDLGAARS